jgi:hypothetical protein
MRCINKTDKKVISHLETKVQKHQYNTQKACEELNWLEISILTLLSKNSFGSSVPATEKSLSTYFVT